MFEAVFLPSARAIYDRLSAIEQDEIDRIVHLIESDPWLDGATKFPVTIDPHAAGVYADGRWEVVYRVVDNRFVEVVGFSRVPDRDRGHAPARLPAD